MTENTITKKSIIENLAPCFDWQFGGIEKLWKDIKQNNFAGKYRSKERMEKFWDRYSSKLSDNFLN